MNEPLRLELRVAIIGSGPSGYYATEALLKSGRPVSVDMFERLPVPYGLVRSGVAPDHPKLKQVVEVYSRIAATAGYRYFGNVEVGRRLTIEILREHYHAIIVCCGAETDRTLGIAGEELPGSHTATEFVGWYNGHPDFRDREFDLSGDVAVILGQGNVAADVARILARDVDELRQTDIAAHALDALAESRIRDIWVIGRRGPAQAKFTPRELREFAELAGVEPLVEPEGLLLNPASEIEARDGTNNGPGRILEIFREFSEITPLQHWRRRVHFAFLKSPVALLGNDRVEAVRLEHNVLEGEPYSQTARGTGRFMEMDTGLVFRSIGYRGRAFAGLPFDHPRGVIPNQTGRVLVDGQPTPGLYVAGWIKRGPTGIIGTNRADAVETVQSLLADFPDSSLSARPGQEIIPALLERLGLRAISFDDWRNLDAQERERGSLVGKPREKYTRVSEMIAALD